MGFEKGHAKMGGIQKGQKQARTQFREMFEAMLGKTIPERLNEIIGMGGMDPLQEADLLVKILPYCYNKLNAIDISGSVDILHTEKELVEREAIEVLRLVDMK